MERFVVLDTETTGLDVNNGDKIIEIGCVEIIDRKITENFYHKYINPEREVNPDAYKIHGLSNKFLKDKPSFNEIIDSFVSYISNSPLIIHNAPFDMGFLRKEFLGLNKEVEVLGGNRVIHDTLKVARKKFPGKRNSLDALCDRFDVDKTERNTHGALLDAKLLANVYLRMTQGQTDIQGLSINNSKLDSKNIEIIDNRNERIIFADDEEIEAHKNYFNS